MTAQKQQPPTVANQSGTAVPAAGFFARSSTSRILPFAVYMAFIAIADVLSRLGVNAEQMRWLYPVKIVAVVAVLLAYRHAYAELAVRKLSLRATLASCGVGALVLVLWISLDAHWMRIGQAAGFNPTDGAGSVDWRLVAVRIAGAALVVPLMEELFWRSFLMRWLQRQDFLNVYPAQVGLRAIAVTVVLFGFEHDLWLAGIVAGAAYSWIYMRTGNLWSPILAHAVTNGLLGIWVVATASWTYW